MKCGSLPAKTDTAKQREFYEAELQPKMEQAKKGKITLLFMDASHFVMGCDFLGYIYGTVRRFVKTFSSRKRYNVLGAINFLTKKVTTVTNNTYITAGEVCELLRKLAAEYAGKAINIVLDNARYQKCKVVQELSVELKITLIYIPPYSPNLNLIERLWKFVKGRLRTRYYDEFVEFSKQIDFIVSGTCDGDKQRIDSLIGEKVQLFDDLVEITPNTFKSNKPQKLTAA